MKTEIEVTEGITLTLAAYNKLQAELTAERERREAAEQIVDHAIAHASYAGTRVMAQEYRTKFPKGDDHD